ncbi:acyltransferase [Paraoerskovia sediminicola]|uniref:Acyltransferase n=1 Tax=Paraoerskovia sediminicola TaxID=1138587 RepID=A0ABM8G457_9CELL|nr:acyltransferase [Paraoerskovia sediminicola]BDZ42886.1 acyltransferase [Paraoerskovia sediminicola]
MPTRAHPLDADYGVPVSANLSSTALPADPTAHDAPRRLRALDGLRLVAASVVLLYHLTGVDHDYWGATSSDAFPILNEVSRYGFLGVQAFFVISGFAIVMTCYDRPLGSFVASRIGRLFPAYWAAIAITAVLQVFWHGGRTPSAIDTLLNLTMVQDPFGGTSVQVVFWTLLVELKFYLLIGVLVAVGITRGRLIAFAMLWPLVGQLAQTNDATFLTALLFPDYAPYFSLGILLFLVFRDGNDAMVWFGLAVNAILCLRLLNRYAGRASELVGGTVLPAVCIAVFLGLVALIWLATVGPLADLRWRWLTTAGALTYPLYLVHSQFGYAVVDVLHDRLDRWVVLGLAVAVPFVLAWAVWRWVERPLGPRLRRGIDRGLSVVPGATGRRTTSRG